MSHLNIQVFPALSEERAGHIAHALSLNLPEADDQPLKTLTLIANGPSAQDAPLDGDTLCVNGAIQLFHNTGRTPTYWAACDPQALVADFIPDPPPRDVIYLVASQCHADVFAKLKGYDVRVWHIDNHAPSHLRSVKCASTITLCAMRLMHRIYSYRVFDVYGWDACYREVAPGVIQHHASDDALSAYPPDMIEGVPTISIAGKTLQAPRSFKTRAAWIAELEDAATLTHHADYTVNVHGDGMIASVLNLARQAA